VERAAKAELVTVLQQVFESAGVVVVTHYSGLSVAQMTDYRNRMRAAGGSVKVAKNRLAKIALKDTNFGDISELLKGPTCLSYSDDPIAAAKIAVEYAKGNDKLVILGGAMGNSVLDADGVKALASLPSLYELRGKLVGLIQAPATKIARIAKEPGGQLARVLSAKAQQSDSA
jgi:large subunit ribosomal protein L10